MTESYIRQGDCLDLISEIPADSVDLLLTDCPYKLISGGCTGMHGLLSGKENSDIKTGGLFRHNDIKFSDWLPEVYRVLKDGSHAYIMVNARNIAKLQTEAEKCGFKFVNLLVWEKNNVTANRYYMQKCEFILLLRKGKARTINNPGTANIFHIKNIKGSKLHPAQKPIGLLKVFIENSTSCGGTVFDPFMGCGSTCIACMKTGRKYIGFELDERYFEIAKERISRGGD